MFIASFYLFIWLVLRYYALMLGILCRISKKCNIDRFTTLWLYHFTSVFYRLVYTSFIICLFTLVYGFIRLFMYLCIYSNILLLYRLIFKRFTRLFYTIILFDHICAIAFIVWIYMHNIVTLAYYKIVKCTIYCTRSISLYFAI